MNGHVHRDINNKDFVITSMVKFNYFRIFALLQVLAPSTLVPITHVYHTPVYVMEWLSALMVLTRRNAVSFLSMVLTDKRDQ